MSAFFGRHCCYIREKILCRCEFILCGRKNCWLSKKNKCYALSMGLNPQETQRTMAFENTSFFSIYHEGILRRRDKSFLSRPLHRIYPSREFPVPIQPCMGRIRKHHNNEEQLSSTVLTSLPIQ
jgi:hypothetical protein